MNRTNNFWKIKNENFKNLIVFIAVTIISIISILASSFLVGLINIIRLYIIKPNIENLTNVAINLLNTSLLWSFVNEVLRGVLIVIFIVQIYRLFNKSKLSLKMLGVSFDIKQLALFVVGVILMTSMFFLSIFLDPNIQTLNNYLITIWTQTGILLIVLIALANAFWQEVIFRGFLQKRLINSYGILGGILLTSFLFTCIHGLARDINFIEIILGTVLFTFVGILYHFTDSIIFACSIHATGNFFLRSFASNDLIIPDQFSRLIIYGLFLLLVVFLFRKKILLKITA